MGSSPLNNKVVLILPSGFRQISIVQRLKQGTLYKIYIFNLISLGEIIKMFKERMFILKDLPIEDLKKI